MALSPEQWDEWVPRIIGLALSVAGFVFFVREGLKVEPQRDLLILYGGFVCSPGPIEYAQWLKRKRRTEDQP